MSTTAPGEFAVMVAGLTERTLRTQRSMKWGAVAPDVLPAWVAQMDFTPPACIRAAITAQIDHGDTGYALGGGLGEAIAGWAKRHYGWHIAPEWVVLVPDLDFALAAAQRASTAPGPHRDRAGARALPPPSRSARSRTAAAPPASTCARRRRTPAGTSTAMR